MIDPLYVNDKVAEMLDLKERREKAKREWENDRRTYTDEIDDMLASTMRSLRRNGVPISEIMKEYGTQDRHTILGYLGRVVVSDTDTDTDTDIRSLKAQRQRAVKRWRGDLPNRLQAVDDDISIIMQTLYEGGVSQRRIAECYGTTNQATIKSYLERDC